MSTPPTQRRAYAWCFSTSGEVRDLVFEKQVAVVAVAVAVTGELSARRIRRSSGHGTGCRTTVVLDPELHFVMPERLPGRIVVRSDADALLELGERGVDREISAGIGGVARHGVDRVVHL